MTNPLITCNMPDTPAGRDLLLRLISSDEKETRYLERAIVAVVTEAILIEARRVAIEIRDEVRS